MQFNKGLANINSDCKSVISWLVEYKVTPRGLIKNMGKENVNPKRAKN